MTRCMSRLVMRADVDDDETVGSDLHDDLNVARTQELFRCVQEASFESSELHPLSSLLAVEFDRIVT